MGIRSALSELIVGDLVLGRLKPYVRELVEEILAHRSFVRPGELDALRDELTASADAARLDALEKKLDMVMNAVQAATEQAAEATAAVVQTKNTAQQATQIATTARNTAEAAADGVTGVEERLSALLENLAKDA